MYYYSVGLLWLPVDAWGIARSNIIGQAMRKGAFFEIASFFVRLWLNREEGRGRRKVERERNKHITPHGYRSGCYNNVPLTHH